MCIRKEKQEKKKHVLKIINGNTIKQKRRNKS